MKNKVNKKKVKKPIKKVAKKPVKKQIPKKKTGGFLGKYVIDTSIIAAKKLSFLIEKKGLRGKVIIPDASIAELEHQANIGKEIGFDGLDELAKLHKFKNKYSLKIEFAPPRPTAHEIKYAKSGEIDALIRSLAFGKEATLITSDFVQAKSAAAYGIKVWFVRAKPRVQKKSFSFFGKR
ncbi:PIN domain-containing protein [Nanoarchaeota archaeon]